jgi:hypothetical protein
MNQIPLKYVKNPNMKCFPKYNSEGELLGYAIIYNGRRYYQGKTILLKYFSETAREYLLGLNLPEGQKGTDKND